MSVKAVETLLANGFQLLTTTEIMDAVKSALLVRQGETVTPELAEERARNIAAAFVMSVITK